MNITIAPKKSIQGKIKVPGDKSISHRALMFGAIAEGETEIKDILRGEDVMSTLHCLESLGVKIENKQDTVIVHGNGLFGLKAPDQILDAGNSGTTMRLLSGILAGQNFQTELTGDSSLRKRPMNRIADPLRAMGADIQTSENGRPPLTITGKKLTPLNYISPVASAQVKSCVLLAGLHTEGTTSVTEPVLSRDHTERILEAFGVPVKRDGLRVSVNGHTPLKGTAVQVPGDISSAAFFLVAASLMKDSEMLIQNIGINPSRIGILDVLIKMGSNIRLINERILNGEPFADIEVKSSQLMGTVIEGDIIPKVIDEIPILAIAATQAEGKTIIRDASELRVKETDRVQTVTDNLQKMGIDLEAKDDGFIIEGPQPLKGTVLESYGDHRIAMGFAVASLLAETRTVIQHAECAEISFPGFYDLLQEKTK